MASGGANDGKEAEDPNVIRILVENVKDLDKIGKEEHKIIDGFSWDLIVIRRSDGLKAQIYTDKSNECAIWDCEVEGEIKLVNRLDDSRSICEKFSEILDFEIPFIDQYLIAWETLIGDNELVVDGNILIEAKIIMKNKHGHRMRKRCKLDFSAPSEFSDAILIIEGKQIHVNKQILAISSSYFHSLFFGGFKESQEKAIELKDVSADDFVTALEIIYGTECNISDDVEGQLRLAQMYDIPKIMDEAEKWLLNKHCFPEHKELLLADQYKLPVLQRRVLANITSFEEMTVVKQSESYKHYSVQLMDKIIEKLLELGQKENEGVMDVVD